MITAGIVTGNESQDTFMMKNHWLLIPLILTGMISGCATGISRQARSEVTYHGTFAQLQEHPENFIGETVFFGGKIIAVKTLAKTTELMILQLALDNQGYPQDNDHSEGRFLIVSDTFLDPAIYKTGHLVTVVGILVSTETRRIGERPYRYPKIKVRKIRQWPPDRQISPRIRFRFGFGASF